MSNTQAVFYMCEREMEPRIADRTQLTEPSQGFSAGAQTPASLAPKGLLEKLRGPDPTLLCSKSGWNQGF